MDILKVISKVSSLSETAEVTLEANPTKLETKKLKEFKKAGINRLSIGVQSLWPDYLKVLNRNHSVDEAVRCIKKAKNIFPGKVSVDMMFALPFQTVDEWQKDLEAMLQICDDHLSLYQLTLEKGTKLYKAVHSGNLSVPDEEIQADLYEMAVSVLQDNLFHRYEVSNFAKTTEAESIHNKAVWQGTQFIGIGPGAHSRVYAATEDSLQHSKTSGSDYIREARRNVADPASWLAEVNGKGNGIRLRETQSMLDIQLEYISTSLRTMEGVNHQRWMDICSIPLNEYINPDSVDNEILYYDTNGDFRATPKGLNVLDSYLPKLINMIRDCTQRSNGIVLNNK